MKQILVATDFSNCASNAMEYAVELAKKSAEESKKAEQIAQKNMDEFNANPMAYLTNHPDAGKTNAAQ